MNFELVKWILGNLTLHAVSLDGEIYVNNKTICAALDIPEASLRSLLRDNAEEFDMLRPLVRFLDSNREALGIKQIRKDMVWHSAEEVYGICYLSGGEKARQTRREFTRLLRTHEQIQIQFSEKDAEIAALKRVVQRSGSYFGSGLSEVKKARTTKAF